MNTSFYNKIANSNAHRAIRDELSGMVLNDKKLFPDLLDFALNVSDENHHKACWVLELVCEARIVWLKEYLSHFCNTLPLFTNDSAIRPIAKICLFTAKQCVNVKEPDFITKKEIQQIIEACFDWLIDPDRKVAPKAYAMRTLYVLGKNIDWIYPELQPILEQGFSEHTAAYKAATKNILREIQKRKRKQG